MLHPGETAPAQVIIRSGEEAQAVEVVEMTVETNVEETGARAGAMNGGRIKDGLVVEERRALVGIAEAGTEGEIRTDARRGRTELIPLRLRGAILLILRPKLGNRPEVRSRPGN